MPDSRIADAAREGGKGGRHVAGLRHRMVGDRAADGDAVAIRRDARHLGHAAEINQRRWLTQTRLQRRDQGLTARDGLRVVLPKRRNSVGDGGGFYVIEVIHVFVLFLISQPGSPPRPGQGWLACPDGSRCGRPTEGRRQPR